MPDDSEYVEVEVEGVTSGFMEPHRLVLRDRDRRLGMVIGPCEAVAIMQRRQDGFESTRPLTHDLAISLWKQLGAEVIELRIDSLFLEIYYARLVLELQDGRVELDCRPSDGVALALTSGAPIYVAEQVFADADRDPPTEDEA